MDGPRDRVPYIHPGGLASRPSAYSSRTPEAMSSRGAVLLLTLLREESEPGPLCVACAAAKLHETKRDALDFICELIGERYVLCDHGKCATCCRPELIVRLRLPHGAQPPGVHRSLLAPVLELVLAAPTCRRCIHSRVGATPGAVDTALAVIGHKVILHRLTLLPCTSCGDVGDVLWLGVPS